ncbi:hypothetical protein Francci3_3007 [Frankia casuarinae]|uniref:AbiEi antitoxin N-terminal domain-containing protein n=2 Tax=Frankia casuarinae (strain DSM 45818 / CECT 9043 / HFP020203 / CcI3) TaxID=106370 RepID=Q2J8M8_FRACC|nr:hypothetical protein Francci3_3007 [Frankia casuarinae]
MDSRSMTFSASASSPPTRPVRYPGFDPAVRIAGRQGGAITYRQAMAAGLTRGQLRQLVHSGQWSHPVRGVFVVPLGPTELPGSVNDVPRPGDRRRAEHSEIREKESAGLVRNDVARRRRKRHGAITAGPGHAASVVGGENTTPILPVFFSPFSARVRAALIGRPRAVVCGITAARLHGFPLEVPESSAEPVHLLLPARQTRAQPRGIRLHFSDLDVDQRVELGGIPLTSPERTLADLVLAAQSREVAVAHLDAALHRGLVPSLAGARAAAEGRRGFRQTTDWWSLADGRAETPLETRLRLLLADNGLAPVELQWPVMDGTGQIITRLDLAWPAQRLDVEADTFSATSPPAMIYQDRHRGNILAALRWTVLRFSVADVTWYPERVVSAVTRVLAARAAERAEASRAVAEASAAGTAAVAERLWAS